MHGREVTYVFYDARSQRCSQLHWWILPLRRVVRLHRDIRRKKHGLQLPISSRTILRDRIRPCHLHFLIIALSDSRSIGHSVYWTLGLTDPRSIGPAVYQNLFNNRSSDPRSIGCNLIDHKPRPRMGSSGVGISGTSKQRGTRWSPSLSQRHIRAYLGPRCIKLLPDFFLP